MTHEEKVQEVMDALVAEARWPADGLSLVTQQDVLLCDGRWMTIRPDMTRRLRCEFLRSCGSWSEHDRSMYQTHGNA